MNFNESDGLDLGSSSREKAESSHQAVGDSRHSSADLMTSTNSGSFTKLLGEAKKANPLLLGFLILLIVISVVILFKTTRRPEPPRNIIEVAGPDNFAE